MENGIRIFNSPQFGQIRTTVINDEVWFVGKDVAEALKYENARDALSKHVEAEDKGVAKCDTLGGKQNMTIINESGVYALIFGSKLESAKRFKHWITSEVLPTIRRTGCYGNTDAQRDVRMSAVIDKMLDIQKQQMDIIRSLIDADTSKDRDVYDKTQDVYNDTQESVGFYTGLPKEHMFTEYSSNIIRDLRKELGISQSELSRRSDIERGYIVHLERGRNRPSTPLFFKLIKAMGYIMVLLERDRIEGDEKWMMR